MTTQSIRQTVTLPGTPKQVFAALTDPKQHSKLSDAAATGKPVVGGKFTAYDGYIHGIYRELEPGKKIVMDWQADERLWPEEHWSTITITLAPTKSGTTLTFVQTNVPEEHVSSIADGWTLYYWQPLKKFLAA